MYRFHVAIADLVPPGSGERDGLPRLPILEQLLARADCIGRVPDWRCWALRRLGCRVDGDDPALAALLAQQAGLVDGRQNWFVLTPLHLVAGLTTVHHHVGGPVVLTQETASELVAGLRRDFNDADLSFHCVGNAILMGVATSLEVRTLDPALLAGCELSAGVPTGTDARRLSRLCGEFEMWLHGLQVRGRDGRAVHALHPWGNGRGVVSVAESSPLLRSDDPFLQAACAKVTNATAVLEVWSVAQLLAQGKGFAEADRQWASPLSERLRDGEVAAAEVHAAGRVYALHGRQRWRFWRRVRPWWDVLS